MATRKKPRTGASRTAPLHNDETLANKSTSSNEAGPSYVDGSEPTSLTTILNIMLNINNGEILPLESKRSLRCCSKLTKTIIDPFITAIHCNYDATTLAQLRRSTWARNSKEIIFDSCICRNAFSRLSRLQLPNLEKLKLEVSATALDLLPRRQWPKLKELNLSIVWNFLETPRINFRSFSQATWPLETLILDITLEEDAIDEVELNDDEVPDIDFGEAAKLLTFFPQLKTWQLCAEITADHMLDFAAVEHTSLEKAIFNFSDMETEDSHDVAAALASARWPNLRDLELHNLGHICRGSGLSDAAWFKNLRSLKMDNFSSCAAGVTELIHGLRDGCIEELELESVSGSALTAFHDGRFPKLRAFRADLLRPSLSEEIPSAPNEGFAALFSADVPCLEEIAIKYTTYHGNSYLAYYGPKIPWDVPPPQQQLARDLELLQHQMLSGGNNTNNTTTTSTNNREGAATNLPALKSLQLSGLCIKPACCQFLAQGLLARGCAIDLERCSVESGFDVGAIREVLQPLNLHQNDFDAELSTRGLTKSVYWYNMVDFAELRKIAVSVALTKFTENVTKLIAPAQLMFQAAAADVAGGDALMQERLKEAQAAAGKLAEVTPHSIDTAAAVANAIAGGSGGGGGSGGDAGASGSGSGRQTRARVKRLPLV